MHPLPVMMLIALFSINGGGLFFSEEQTSNAIEIPSIKEIWQGRVDKFKHDVDWWATTMGFEEVNWTSLTINDLAALILALPGAIVTLMLDTIFQTILSIFEIFISLLEDGNRALDNFMIDFLLDSQVSGYDKLAHPDRADELKNDPLFVSWQLIKGIILVFFWLAMIRLLVFVQDVIPVI